MNPSGLWRGVTGGRVGHFKFINVEMLPEQSNERKRSDRRKKSNASYSSGHDCSSNSHTRRRQSAPSQHNKIRSLKDDAKEEVNYGSMVSTGISHTKGAIRAEDVTPTVAKSNVKASKEDVSNLNSRPRSVEDLLRRIGLEVGTLFDFK